jgi:hypothetical protein
VYDHWLYGELSVTIDPAAITNAITNAAAVAVHTEGSLDKMARDHCSSFEKNMASVAHEVQLLRAKEKKLSDAKKIRRQSFRREKAHQPHLPVNWNIPNGGKMVRIDKWVGLAREKHPEVVRLNNWVGMLEKSRNDTAKWLRDERVKARQNYSFMVGFAAMEPLLMMASLEGSEVAAKALTYSCDDKVPDKTTLKQLFGSNHADAKRAVVPVDARQRVLRMYNNFHAATGAAQGPFDGMEPPAWVWGFTPAERRRYVGLFPTVGDYIRMRDEIRQKGFSGAFGVDEPELLKEIRRRIKKGTAQPVSKKAKGGEKSSKKPTPLKKPTKPDAKSLWRTKPATKSLWRTRSSPPTQPAAITTPEPAFGVKTIVPWLVVGALGLTWMMTRGSDG